MTVMDHAYAEEHGLVDAYLGERLSESEREEFEAHFFACETCLAQLETESDFREGMRDIAAEETARARLGLLAWLAAVTWGSWTRRLALGGALLLLLALPLGILAARNRGLERQLAQARAIPTAPPAASGEDPRVASLEARLKALQESGSGDLQKLEQELAKERQTRAEENRPRVNVPIFMLAAVRSGEEAGREPVNRIPLPPGGGPVILTLELATVDYPSYHASLRSAGGQEAWQAGGLRPDGRDALTLLLPSGMLAPGAYTLTIEGAKKGGKSFVVGAYPFQVVRP